MPAPASTTAPAPSPDAIVVGSGPGGASVARELAARGLRVLILEQGSAAPLKGTLAQMARIAAVPGKGAFIHRDASLLVQGINAGGSSSINFATAADPPLARFAALGIDLGPALHALRAELPIGPLPDSLIGPAASRIMQGALALGMDWRKLDKMIRPQLCRSACWRCVYGCPFGAKWSARDFIDQACAHGATLLDQARATRVLVQDGKAAGVEYMRGGKLEQALAPLVILAGGGVGSPRLLHASGLRARFSSLFSDPVVAVMGTVGGLDGGAEVPMAAGMRLDQAGISLADMTLPKPMYQAFTAQAGRFDRLFAHRRTLSIMVKIADQAGGAVGPRWVDKTLHQRDRDKLAQGEAMARAILAGCGATHVFKSHHFAAHPGGSVRIGDGVDATLQAGAAGVHVCDASVIPGPWGLPPTLTLLCLGKWLGQRLAR
ncbi:GMC family oxidoreductase N-terminal domain-containing protein [Massilia genomosp. 1]|uniref:FAD-binding protein n=1 Tax=Massilia genomosp. 1 TaxID=2609280 RepID=A0ABX0MQM8_9BURK|nr:GMC family oxidoreductase N-terminal domain-containing protein [Massilia genomosp. 1]NHZ65063.1 FAD-binding protein [Massilia genomosp. 1]